MTLSLYQPGHCSASTHRTEGLDFVFPALRLWCHHGDSQRKVPLLTAFISKQFPDSNLYSCTLGITWPHPLTSWPGTLHAQREQVNFLKHTARPLIATPPLVRLQKHSSKRKLFHLLLNLRPGKIEELGHGQTPSLSWQCGLGIVISLPHQFLPTAKWGMAPSLVGPPRSTFLPVAGLISRSSGRFYSVNCAS